jgi:HD-like signal output (HDOD) protein/GGDEF domain-containing protein
LADATTVLNRFVDKAGKLYTLPAVAVQVLQLTNHPRVDVQRLKACVENDPALTTKVLRVANSSLFGPSRKVSDLNQALTMLGTKSLKLLVLGFSLPGSLFVGVAGDILRRYWRRTLTKAVAAREISETIWKLPGDEAFLIGLLQDIGMLVLLQELGEPYARFLDLALAKASDIAVVEEKSLGFDHARLSAELLRRWGLPAAIVDPICAGRPVEKLAALPITERRLPQILRLADLLASVLTENRADLLADLLDCGAQFNHLTHTQLSALVNTLQEKVELLADVLSLELPDGRDYATVLLQAHGRLSEVASEVAGEIMAAEPATDSATDLSTGSALEGENLLAEVQSLAASVRRLARSPLRPHIPPGEESSVVASPPSNELSPRPEASLTYASAAHQGVPATHVPKTQAPATPAEGQGDPGFLGAVTAIVSSCRQSRCPLSLLLVEVDRFEDLLMTRGLPASQRMVGLIGTICQGLGLHDAICRQRTDSQFALILPGYDRWGGVEAANQLLRELRHIAAGSPTEAAPSMTVSIGLAAVLLPPKNFRAQDLIESAERCLHAAQRCGGNALKSIEA